MNAIEEMMRQAGCTPAQTRRFCGRVQQYLADTTSSIAEDTIRPVDSIPKITDLSAKPDLLRQAAMVKLNGGLGTSMGLTAPKGCLEVKDGKDFYEVLVEQVRAFRAKADFQPPLLFMNSFNTEEETEARLQALGFEQDLPLGFLQSQVPKILEDGTLPEGEGDYLWCPPGHGDIYASLLDSGLKKSLLDSGVRFLFVSNIDNLGAVLDSRPLAYMLEHNLSFLMEVTRRGESDKKGGHLARTQEGGLLLREVAQCPPGDLEHFQNIERHRFFNTNNLWIDLQALNESWTELPLIINKKPIKPQEPESQQIVQLEQAMGAAIGVVDSAGAVEVERDRFLPVKTTNDLFLIRSDLYRLDENSNLVAERKDPPNIQLDPKHFKLISDYEELVQSIPSLADCNALKVDGPVRIHDGLEFHGDVHLRADS